MRNLRHREVQNSLLVTQLPSGRARVQTQRSPRAQASDHCLLLPGAVGIIPHIFFSFGDELTADILPKQCISGSILLTGCGVPLPLTSLLQTQHLCSRPHPSPVELTLCAHPHWPSQRRVRHHHQFSSAGVCRCAVCGILNSLNSLWPGASHLFFPKCKTTTKPPKPHKLPSSNDSVLPPLPQTSVCPLPSRAPASGLSDPPLSPG